MLKKYFGTRCFYSSVLMLLVPIFIQNFITNFVSMLDNVMVGRVGQVEMTGVSVANQIILVFNLLIFGAVSGAEIIGAQYVGKDDVDGVRNTFRIKIISALALSALGITVFLLFGKTLINQFLLGDGATENARLSLEAGTTYLYIILIGIIPQTVASAYSSTLRENGHTVLPMIAGISAVGVNLFLNWVLIFGSLGAPKMGVAGAAVATTVSRFAELSVVVLATHLNKKEHRFIEGAYRGFFRIPKELVKQVAVKITPLMINETMWCMGMTFLNQCYSLRGLDVVAANTITTTFSNVFSVSFISLGSALGIYVGQKLGASEFEEAYDSARKLIVLSVIVSTVTGGIFAALSSVIPGFYVVSDEVKSTATKMILVYALCMPLDAIANGTYFSLRSGGQVLITMIFDSGMTWALYVPVAYVLSRFTQMPIIPMYFAVNMLYIVKDALGLIFFMRKKWVKNILIN